MIVGITAGLYYESAVIYALPYFITSSCLSLLSFLALLFSSYLIPSRRILLLHADTTLTPLLPDTSFHIPPLLPLASSPPPAP